MKKIMFIAGVGVVAGFSVLPFLWFAMTSWKTATEISAIPPVLWPSFHWRHYQAALAQYGLLHYIVNSAIVAGATTVVSILIASLAAYALARFKLRWGRYYLLLLLALSMFPQIAIAGPIWRLLSGLGWLNSYQGIVAAYISLSLPFAIWVLATFFKELPYDIEEAALIDGCSRWQMLRHVVFPLAAPGIFTTAILVFIHAWNEFFFALIILTYPAVQTLPVGIALFPGEYTMPWGEIAAASTLATVPLIVLTLIFQRRIVQGLSAGAVKG
jgi:trehalose/maltose transport system permease protein